MKICVIPARGGSKRIPRKNIKEFKGKPVIAYPIEAALKSGLFDEVVVTTDDDEIAQVAIKYGASVPFKRPVALSGDHVATAPVLIHAIEWFENLGHKVTEMTNIYPANPFITSDLLKQAYSYWQEKKSDYCFAVSEFESAPQRALTVDDNGCVMALYPEFTKTRTQDLPKTFYNAGMFYFTKAAVFAKGVPMHSQAATPFFLPRHMAHDIDTEADWDYAETIYEIVKRTTSQKDDG